MSEGYKDATILHIGKSKWEKLANQLPLRHAQKPWEGLGLESTLCTVVVLPCLVCPGTLITSQKSDSVHVLGIVSTMWEATVRGYSVMLLFCKNILLFCKNLALQQLLRILLYPSKKLTFWSTTQKQSMYIKNKSWLNWGYLLLLTLNQYSTCFTIPFPYKQIHLEDRSCRNCAAMECINRVGMLKSPITMNEPRKTETGEGSPSKADKLRKEVRTAQVSEQAWRASGGCKYIGFMTNRLVLHKFVQPLFKTC